MVDNLIQLVGMCRDAVIIDSDDLSEAIRFGTFTDIECVPEFIKYKLDILRIENKKLKAALEESINSV